MICLVKTQQILKPPCTCTDHVKVWTETNDDRDGWTFVSLDTFHCFKAIEMVTYDLIMRGSTKEDVTCQVFVTFPLDADL